MKKKLLLTTVLLLAAAVFSFGETYFGTTIGYYRFSDEFLKESYGRSMNGTNYIFSYHYFPEERPLGFLARVSSGSFNEGLEWKSDTEINKTSASVWDIQVCFAPTYKFKLGSKVQIPIALGPAFSLSGEEDSYNYYWDGSFGGSNETLYHALNLGLLTDAAILLSPVKYFFIMSGLSVGWNFLHLEKGIMNTGYRDFRSARYKVTPYTGLSFTAYLGVGVRFD